MMLIYEYEAKNIFKNYGIPIPKGFLAENLEEVDAALSCLSKGTMLKAQVLTGGRGKSGGMRFIVEASGF